MPVASTSPDPKFPTMQRSTLSNGLQVILVERHELPLLEMALSVDAGYAADQHSEPGMASLVGTMLDEGTATRSALQVSDDLARVGASWRDQGADAAVRKQLRDHVLEHEAVHTDVSGEHRATRRPGPAPGGRRSAAALQRWPVGHARR